MLFPVTWRLSADALILLSDPVCPNLNPAWIHEVRRRTAWTEDALREALFQDEDEPAFGDLADRLAHALARLGGNRLRAAELGTELRLDPEGLSNVAGFFLPGEATFTRAVAADLDRITDWDPEARQGTALGHLLEPSDARAPEPTLAVAEPSALTNAQFAAADAALSGPLTLLQGPPGTGKSQTIVALLCAALAQGKSVLFVARNHRAIDEVENRLKELLPDSPVLTRGRDAEGVRDQGELCPKVGDGLIRRL
ncbi:MAG: AAA family ATPase [Pararhodobacter sp.]|nr:AAA family ATPase [Pararhodobacter sp.]